MADDAGTQTSAVAAYLDETWEANAAADGIAVARDFFVALRRLEVLHREQPRLAEGPRVSEEPVRLGQKPTLAFEASTILSSDEGSPSVPARIEVGFFGAFGPNGPLPLHLTEYAHQRLHNSHDRTLIEFLNIFHHRLLTLFYRAWANAQPTISRDRPASDRFARFVGAAIGQGNPARGYPETVVDRFALFMAPHFTGQTRHPEGLCKLLSTFFGVPAQVEEFLGEWLRVPDDYCWRLTGQSQRHAALGRLGSGTRVGRHVWERQFKFRVVLGPMSRVQYERLLPRGGDLPKLTSLVQRYAGHELRWDLQLVLHEPDMQPMQLGSSELGRSAFLVRKGQRREKRWQDFVFDPMAQAG